MKIKGLYLKNGVYWFQPASINGYRAKPFSLVTKDENEAIFKSLEAHANPVLQEVDIFEVELKRYLEQKLLSRKMSDSMARVRNYTLKAFARRFGIKSPSKITPEIVQSYHDILAKEGIADSTINAYIFGLRSFCRWLKEKGKIASNPCIGVEMNRLIKSYKHKTCTQDQVDQLIESASLEMKFILLCGFDAGMRRNEIVECRPSWFKVPGIVNLSNSEDYEFKDGNSRFIPLTKRFEEFLEDYGKPYPFMIAPWKTEKGRSVYRYDLRAPFEKYVTSMGMSWVKPHTMRHTFASLRVQSGVSIYKVAKWLGNGVDVVQNHYGFLAPGYDKDIEV